MFPFESRFFTTAQAHQMHYVGESVVFVHGNPAWSFEFRHLITGLRPQYRCIAADHIGFGLSSRSNRPDDHHPRAHAAAFEALMLDLDVGDATLFLTDSLVRRRRLLGIDLHHRHHRHLRFGHHRAPVRQRPRYFRRTDIRIRPHGRAPDARHTA